MVEDVEVVDEVHLDRLDILDHLDTLGCKRPSGQLAPDRP